MTPKERARKLWEALLNEGYVRTSFIGIATQAITEAEDDAWQNGFDEGRKAGAEKEREACAKVAVSDARYSHVAKRIAAAIRGRGDE